MRNRRLFVSLGAFGLIAAAVAVYLLKEDPRKRRPAGLPYEIVD
jgi:hypothetical protein